MGKTKKSKKASDDASKKRPSKEKPPFNPYTVLTVSIFLPGVGQVLNNTPTRGLFMVFFMLVGAWICFNTTTPQHSILGRYAGGWFVYAISILDAYRFAKIRYEIYRYHYPEAAA